MGASDHTLGDNVPQIMYYGTFRIYTKARLPDPMRLTAREAWAAVHCLARIMAVHRRAVVSANDPGRKRARGEFEISDEPDG